MTVPMRTPTQGDIMESVLINGDLAKLTPEERTRYYNGVCRSLGLNPLTQPFARTSRSMGSCNFMRCVPVLTSCARSTASRSRLFRARSPMAFSRFTCALDCRMVGQTRIWARSPSPTRSKVKLAPMPS